MRAFAILCALGALPASAAIGQAAKDDSRPVAIAPEQAVSFRIDAAGAAGETARERAEWNATDIESARGLIALDAAGDPSASGPNSRPVGGTTTPPPIAGGQVRAKFLLIANRQSLLVIENGYRQALVYRARITHDGRTEPTDVCLVVPDRRGYEHWPYVIDRIELSGFQLVDWHEGDPVPCA